MSDEFGGARPVPMVSPDGLNYWDGDSWVRLPGEQCEWDGYRWHAKPPGVEAHWDGSQWLVKPDGVDSEWTGEGWAVAPSGVEARWDGAEWQARPSGRAYWNGQRWVKGPRPLIKFGIPVVVVAMAVGGLLYYSAESAKDREAALRVDLRQIFTEDAFETCEYADYDYYSSESVFSDPQVVDLACTEQVVADSTAELANAGWTNPTITVNARVSNYADIYEVDQVFSVKADGTEGCLVLRLYSLDPDTPSGRLSTVTATPPPC